MTRRSIFLAAAIVIACGGNPPHREAPTPQTPAPSPNPATDANDGPHHPKANSEGTFDPHTVVYADRSSHSYMLLLKGQKKPHLWTRDELETLIRKTFPDHDSGEVGLLLEFVHLEPRDTSLSPLDQAELKRQIIDNPGEIDTEKLSRHATDLIALHLDILDLLPTDSPVDPEILLDPVLTRGVDTSQRDDLPKRRWAILIRADYRNQYGVRGLRMLQTLVRILAKEVDAIVLDSDTLETMSPGIFNERRLSANAGNLYQQIAIIPFPQDDGIRLVTRGMRRFGAVDIEWSGLPRDPVALQRATEIMMGLVFVMVRDGEVDPSGLAVQVDDVLEITRRDIEKAYANRASELPRRCKACDERVRVHLVKRAARTTDARDHATARIVAPRKTSDAPGYEQRAWTRRLIDSMYGSGSLSP